MSNTDSKGIRYGVISMNSIDPDVANDLWYGPDAVDVSYQEAYNDAKREASDLYDELLEEANIAAAESGADREVGYDNETWVEKWFDDHDKEYDREMFIERELERFSDICQIDEPNIEGLYEGVHYLISWLGGAPLMFVTQGPVGFCSSLCSPCVPNAASLDSGFSTEMTDEFCYECYIVPADWLYKGTT